MSYSISFVAIYVAKLDALQAEIQAHNSPCHPTMRDLLQQQFTVLLVTLAAVGPPRILAG